MEGQVGNLNDIDVTLTPLMMALAIPISFAIQFIKALATKVQFFQSEEIRKSFFPMVSIAITAAVYYFAGIERWLLASVVMGLTASGGYQAFSGAAKLVKKPNMSGTGSGGGMRAPGTTAMVLILCSLLIFGCETFQQDPRAELLAAQKTFSATVDSLTVLHRAGKINQEDTQMLTVLIHQGQDYLIAWEEALKAGNPKPDVIWEFQKILDKLIDYQLAKEGGG